MAGRLTPNCIRRAYVKVLLQLISRYDSSLSAILARTAFIADLRTQSHRKHIIENLTRGLGLT